MVFENSLLSCGQIGGQCCEFGETETWEGKSKWRTVASSYAPFIDEASEQWVPRILFCLFFSIRRVLKEAVRRDNLRI